MTLKNIKEIITLPSPPSSIEDFERYNQQLQVALQDYSRMLSDNIIEQPRWEDIRVPGLAVARGASAPDLVSFGPSGNVQAYGFNGAGTSEQVFFAIQLPHACRQGTKLEPHVHWSPSTAASGDVKWNLEYTWANIKAGTLDDYTFGAPTTISCVDSTASVAWEHLVCDFDEIDLDFNLSTMFMCRLYRDPTDAEDTYGADAILLEFDFHVQLDSLGSREEYRK